MSVVQTNLATCFFGYLLQNCVCTYVHTYEAKIEAGYTCPTRLSGAAAAAGCCVYVLCVPKCPKEANEISPRAESPPQSRNAPDSDVSSFPTERPSLSLIGISNSTCTPLSDIRTAGESHWQGPKKW